MNEFLKDTFGDEALTFEQFNERLSSNKNISLANIADGSYVAKSEHDKVAEQLAAANAEKYADFDNQLQTAKDEGAAALKAYKFNVEVSKALAEAHVADELSVKANLKLDDIKIDDEGKLTGLEEQLKSLKETKPFLFAQEQKKLNLGGSTPGVKVIKSSSLGTALSEHYRK